MKPSLSSLPSIELVNLCRRGIPTAYRGKLWLYVSKANLLMEHYPEDYFESLQVRSNSILNDKVKREIEKDVQRTFPSHEFYKNNSEGLRSLRKLLRAYAVRFHNDQINTHTSNCHYFTSFPLCMYVCVCVCFRYIILA